MERRLRASLVLLGAAVIGASGCGGDGLPDLIQVRGKVLYNDAPLTTGTIVYLPAVGSGGRQAQGLIQPDGTFELSSMSPGDGAQKGDYDVIILAHAQAAGPPKSRGELEAAGGPKVQPMIIPAKYADPNASGLSDTVDDDHPGYREFKLTD
jgi:hypothetical protein